MRYRTIAGTDLQVSEIGFGSGGNAGLMVRGQPDEQLRVVARALELGINYFDTAPDYGDGIAEQALGRALREIGAHPLITSKVEVRRQDLGDIAGHVVRSAEASLRRLGVERLDILQIHNGPTAAPPGMEEGGYHHLWIEHFLGAGGALEGLRRLLDRGSVRYAGFVCRGDDAEQVRRLLDTRMFRMINVPYTLLNPSAGIGGFAAAPDYGDVIGAAQARDCGAAIFSPLAGGYLAGAGGQHALARPVAAASAGARRKQALAARFGFLAEHCGGAALAAYRFILMHPGVTTAVGGFSSLEQIEEVAGASGQAPLPAEMMARVAEVWRTANNR